MRSPRRARLLLAAAGAATFVLVPASPALAHAVVVSANPAPATGLPQAPGAVVMRFSEPLNRRLSGIQVRGHSGGDVGVGRTTAVAGDVRAMERKLGALRPDLYTVAWTTVSRVDGHTLRGSYTFGVGVDATTDIVTHDNPVSSEGWLGLGGRLCALAGLVLWAGVAIAGPVARAWRARRPPPPTPGPHRSWRRPGAHVHGSGPQGTALDADLVACGLGCFAGRAEAGATGDWRFEASIVSNRGPVVMAFKADGLVRGEEMRTEGQLMDHTWSDFDQPVDIRPPL